MNPLEKYFEDLRDIHASGAGVPEESYYPSLQNLFNEIGKHLKPHVRCIMQLANRGAGEPDGGFFTEDQYKRRDESRPLLGQIPARGVVEIKSARDNTWLTAEGPQVSRYWGKYKLVLVTNYRDFVLLGQDAEGKPAKLESYRLAPSEKEFWTAVGHPRTMAKLHEQRFSEYLKRVLLHAAPIATPKDLALFLASYARDALARVEGHELAPVNLVRKALEEALGLKFEGDKGEHFFRSTLVQTLFYGVFSAWVLWAKQRPPTSREQFDWLHTAQLLRVPVLRQLFYQVAAPGQLEELKLSEVMDWATAVLNRVDRRSFFENFQESHAVQYFYEPFLAEFDPQLRKELGVWYTPPEIVEYMVARVDTVLREELGVADGLADKQVYVLDPCCGTGSYLVEVLKRIHATLEKKGKDALTAGDLKEAAQVRVFGFEILPAPFVVAHLQLGLLLQNLGAPLESKKEDRVGVYLTNALTGWEPPKEPKTKFLFPELKEEHDAAEKVKRETPILVILGNPPYNGFAGVAVEEERDLSNAYRTTNRAPAPQGQGLNDLYVRFYRMAERRIVEQTGRGVVCFISNYSWLDGLSFTGMREQYVEKFARVWVDSLNGDKYKTGKVTPDGQPDPSVFSTEWNREGIQVGTAIGLLVKKKGKPGIEEVCFRHLWGNRKRQLLVETAQQNGIALYERLKPTVELGFPFMPMQFKSAYFAWPKIEEILGLFSPGVNTSRDLDLVDIDPERLEKRIAAYFDRSVGEHELKDIVPSLMARSGRFDPVVTRRFLIERGMQSGFFVRYSYRPFDARHVYWHPETKLLDEKREELFAAFQAGNVFLTSRQKAERTKEGTPFFITRSLPDRHLTRPGSICFPATTRRSQLGEQVEFVDHAARKMKSSANLTQSAFGYLGKIGFDVQGAGGLLWLHSLSVGYAPGYLVENRDALFQDWPRVPLPAIKKLLERSAELGRQVAGLLDTESPVEGVTEGEIRTELRLIGVATRAGEGAGKMSALQQDDLDLAVKVGWGHAGKDAVTMPGKGKLTEREYTAAERKAIAEGAKALGLSEKEAMAQLGEKTCDVYLNDMAFWANVPLKVWEYTIGGYQVMKKWLSYREEKLLGRALKREEVRYVQEMARRIAAILLLQPALDENYRTIKDNAFSWQSLRT